MVTLKQTARAADNLGSMIRKSVQIVAAEVVAVGRTSCAILRETFKHPNTTVVIDRKTGKAVSK